MLKSNNIPQGEYIHYIVASLDTSQIAEIPTEITLIKNGQMWPKMVKNIHFGSQMVKIILGIEEANTLTKNGQWCLAPMHD